jgi:glucokinase
MLLATDVGATKTLIGLYRPSGPRPDPLETREYATLDFDSLTHLVRAFLAEVGTPKIDAICAGVAGPVNGLVANLTNAPWVADLGALSIELGQCHAALLNDLEAMAYSVSVLTTDELLVLQAGQPNPTGNAALIAAGTGLNASHIQFVDGRLIPSPSESGHADFAARTPRELALVEELTRQHGRADVESVISGPGIVNVFHFTHRADESRMTCPVLKSNTPEQEIAAETGKSALARKCSRCVETLDIFVAAYGAETGNLALRSLATRGVYIGGGIAPKIVPALKQGLFMEAFLNKPPMDGLLARIPVKVIMNRGAGLIGASVKAATLVQSSVPTR